MEKKEGQAFHVSYGAVDLILRSVSFKAGTPLLEVYAGEEAGVRLSYKVKDMRLYGIAEGPFSVPWRWQDKYYKLARGPWPTLRVKREGFPIVWVNPPQPRLFEFVRMGHRCLMPQGILIFVGIPESLSWSNLEWLARHYPGAKIRQLYYDGPFVFIGQKAVKPVPAAREQVAALWRRMMNPDYSISDPDPEPFRVPVVDGPIEPFEGFYISEKEAEEIIVASPLWGQAASLFQGLTKRKDEEVGQPPTPLHAGHLALMLAAGHLDGLVGEGETAHLIRGKTVKSSYVAIEEDDEKEKVREFYQISISALSPDGTYREVGKGGK